MDNAVFTNAGRNLIAKWGAGAERTIDSVWVGNGTTSSDPRELTDLVTPIAQATSSVPIAQNGEIHVTIQYRNDLNGGLQEGFMLQEYGIFAIDPDIGRIMLCRVDLGDTPEGMPPISAGLTVRSFPLIIPVSGDAEVTVNYDTTAFIDAEDLESRVRIHNADLMAHQNIRTNPNILHNWDFRGANPNPLLSTVVNQRGQTEYINSGTPTFYGIDRWQVRGTLTLVDGAVRVTHSSATFAASFQQPIEFSSPATGFLDGEDVTFSWLINNELYTGTVTVPSGQFNIGHINFPNNFQGTLYRNANSMFLRINAVGTPILGTFIDIQAVKLELGTVSTLANDPPGNEVNNPVIYRFQRLYSINGIDTQGQTSPPMRITPIITQLTSGANAGMFLYDANL